MNGANKKWITTTDDELIRNAVSGNQVSYTMLMNKYYSTVFNCISSLIKNKTDVEDLVIEVFAKAFTNLDKFSHKYKFSTWIYRIAKNHTIDFIKKSKKNRCFFSFDDPDIGVEDLFGIRSFGSQPDEDIQQREKWFYVQPIVNKFTPKNRKIFELRYYKNYSYKEIEKELDMPAHSVKSKLFHIHKKLRKTITKSSIL